MTCKIKSTTAGRVLTAEGISYEYNWFETKKFKKEFGDWVNGKVTDPNRVNEDGSPKILFSTDRKNAFYIDKSNRMMPIFNVKFQTLPTNQRSEISNGITEQLVVELFETKLDFSTKDIDEALDLNFNIHSWVDETLRRFKKMGVTQEIDDSFVHSLDDYVEMLIRRLGSIGIKYKVNDAVKQQASFERNTKDKATSRIKFLLNTMVDEDVAFEFVGKGDNYLPKAVSQSKVWAVLLPTLSNIPNLEGVNPIDQMITRLNKAKEGYPWLSSFVDTIEEMNDNDPQSIKELYAAFNNVKNRINVTEIATNGTRKTFKTMNVEDSNRDSRFISKEWMLDFVNKYESKTSNQFKHLKNTIVPNVISALDAVYKKSFTNNYESRLEETTAALEPLLDELGITGGETFVANALYFWKQASGITHTTNSSALQNYVADLEKKLNNLVSKDWKDDLFDKHLREFAQSEEGLRNDVGLHMATVGQNRVYLFSLPTMIQEKINELKSGAIDITQLQMDFPHLKGSIFLNAWKAKDILKKTYLGLKGVVQLEGRTREAKDGKSITKGDYIRTDFNNVLRVIQPPRGDAYHSPIYSTQTPADKSREYQISTNVFKLVDNSKDAFDKIFQGYIVDELNEMIKARQAMKDALEEGGVTLDEVLENPNAYPEEIAIAERQLIKGYHLSQKGKMFDEHGMFAGGAFKFGVIPALNGLNWPIFKSGVLNIDKVDSARAYYSSKAVQDVVTQALDNDKKAFGARMNNTKMGIVISAGKLKANNIDGVTYDFYRKEYPRYEGEELLEYARRLNNIMALNYITNSIMSKVEFAKIFTGSIQYYKHGSDYIKRVPATYIDGLQPMTGVEEGDQFFNQLTFKTESFESFLAKDGNLPEHIQNYYKYVDRTDAQGYITIDRWAQLMGGVGKMGKKQRQVYVKIKKQWQEVKAGTKISDPLTAKDIKILSMQPVKGVYFENNFDEGPIYLKYSQAVLFPSMAETFPKIKQTMDYMEKYAIDELVAETGVKVGAIKPMELFNLEGEFVASTDPITRVLDNRNWRLQQDLPTKLVKDNKIGVQIQKIIISRLAFLGDTDLGVGLTGKQMLEAIDDTLGKMSDKGVEQFMGQYGISEDFEVKDLERFYAPIIKDLESKDNVSENLLEALRSRVSLAALPTHSKTVVSSFMGGVNAAATDLMTPGGGFIQMSDQLIGKSALQSSGTRMLTEFTGLKPPRVEDRGGKKFVLPGQILIPHSMMVGLVPDYQNMNEEDLKYVMSEVREAIGYRIPTQSRASVDALEIVGILPIELGDAVITYGEITAKTGSDFDIDKLFMMFPEMELSEGKLIKVPEYSTETRVELEIYIDETEITSKQEIDVEGIQGIEKPTIVAQFLKTSDMIEADNPLKAKEQNDEMKTKVKELEDLINCIWG